MREVCDESRFGRCVCLEAAVWKPVHYSWERWGGRAEQCWSVSWL